MQKLTELELIKKLPIDNVHTIKKINYTIPQCTQQVICGMIDGHEYAAYVTPSQTRLIWIEGYGFYKLNRLTE